jgi:hypothetical protein
MASAWGNAWGAAWGDSWGALDAISAAVTGTLGDGATEAEIVASGGTIIITLTGDTWVASGATFDAERQAIIDGLDSNQSYTNGWNAEVRDALAVTTVVRTSDTVVTITVPATAAYDIPSGENITVTIPASALTGAVEETASPTFAISAMGTGSGLARSSKMRMGMGL